MHVANIISSSLVVCLLRLSNPCDGRVGRVGAIAIVVVGVGEAVKPWRRARGCWRRVEPRVAVGVDGVVLSHQIELRRVATLFVVEGRVLGVHHARVWIASGVGVEADAAQLSAIVRGVVLGTLFTDRQTVGLRTVGRVVIVQESSARVAVDPIYRIVLADEANVVARFCDWSLYINVVSSTMCDIDFVDSCWIFQTQNDSWRRSRRWRWGRGCRRRTRRWLRRGRRWWW